MVTSSPPPPPPPLVDTRGKRIALGNQVARGGEGTIYPVRGHPDLVAKVYHQEIPPEKAAKLAAMSQLASDRLRAIAAWPTDTLREHAGSTIRGLLMPLVRDHQEIHLLYVPKTRRREFPNAALPFLLHTATNLARAFAVIHDHGHVIGDVNHGSVLISKQGMVKLVDCDSFQITFEEQQFLCTVGIATPTPPELQGKSFAALTRTANHDAFGLAVLIFQLLFLGRHPFSGTFLGNGDLPLERAIGEYRFAYGPGAAQRLMRQPPGTPPLEVGTPAIAALFKQAFSQTAGEGGERPSASDWVGALDAAKKALVICARHNGHYYPRSPTAGPWCTIEASTGIVAFNLILTGGGPSSGQGFDLDALWRQIESVADPGEPPTLPVPTSLALTPTSTALEHRAEVRRLNGIRQVSQAAGGVIAFFSVILMNNVPDQAILLMALAAIGSFLISLEARRQRKIHPARQAAIHERNIAQRRLAIVEQLWKDEAGNAPFREEMASLVQQKAQYTALDGVRQRKSQELAQNARRRQLEQFLDRYRIASATIPNVGPGRKATLQSYNIETAADVTPSALRRVPGFGPTLVGNLIAWRAAIEAQFVFDPQRAIDPVDLANLEREMATQRVLLEQSLRGGLIRLGRAAEQIEAARNTLQATGDQAQLAIAQAEKDLQVL